MTSPDPRAILAANLLRMIDAAAPAGGRTNVRAWALGKGLNVRMIDRLTKKQHAVTLDKLQEIADACGLQAWHLLIEDLDPAKPPDPTVTTEDRALLARIRNLLDR
jgi:hypothetical protein